MPNATGTSVLATQTLLANVTVVTKQMSVIMTGQPLPPVRRVGYFWLYTYSTVSPQYHAVVEKGIVDAPGVWLNIRVAPFDSTYRYRLDVAWKVPGLAWLATII